MANLQYIGARYVPKIYQNSQDPSVFTWEADTAYEPLVMVGYNSVSYISRKPVPASVGNPYANPEYWCSMGSFNAQVAQYMQLVAQLAEDLDTGLASTLADAKDYTDDEIAPIDARLTAVEGEITGEVVPKLLLVGDSWSAGSGGVPPKGWSYYFESYTGIDCDIITQNGGGFYDVGNNNSDYPGVNYQGAIQLFLTNKSDAEKAAYTGVIYVGGINDRIENYNTVVSAVQSCLNYVKSALPNAEQLVIPVRGTGGPATYRERHTFQAWQDGAGAAGVRVTHNSLYWFYHRSQFEGSSADGYHLNDDGYKLCAKYIEAVYKGADFAYIPYSGGQVYPTYPQDVTPITGHLNAGRTGDGVVTISGKFTIPARAVNAQDELVHDIGAEFTPTDGPMFIPAVFYSNAETPTRFDCIVTLSSAGVLAPRGVYSSYGTDGGTLYVNYSYHVDVPIV